MHKITCCYNEKACDKCVIHADRKFCFIVATQTVFDNLLRSQLQHLFRLAVAVYRFTCFCRAILPIQKLSDKLFALRDFVNLFVDIIFNTAYNGVRTQVIKRPSSENLPFTPVESSCPLWVYLVFAPNWLRFCCKCCNLSHISAF